MRGDFPISFPCLPSNNGTVWFNIVGHTVSRPVKRRTVVSGGLQYCSGLPPAHGTEYTACATCSAAQAGWQSSLKERRKVGQRDRTVISLLLVW